MMQPREVWTLDTHHLGRRVLVFDQLPSTNDFAAQLARETTSDGLAILADTQTAGRGQHGRIWTATPRSSVLLSLILYPPEPLRRPAILTAWAAVAVCRIIKQMIGISARIKWPNDVLVRDKKICGILIEQGRGTVVGIGLNVRQTAADFAALGLPYAASLAQFAPIVPDTATVARELIQQLDAEFTSLIEGDLATLETNWKSHLGLVGRQVEVEVHDGVIHGRLCELTFRVVELERSGQPLLTLPPEKVLHLSLAEPEPATTSGD